MFLSLCYIVKNTEWNGIINIDNWCKIYKDYYEPNFNGFSCILIPLWNGGFDAWPMAINTEYPVDDGAIFRVGVFHSLAFHCKTLNIPWYFDRT